MKFVVAPDKFKGSLNGFEFCDAVKKGLQTEFKDATIVAAPLADGGDGTMEVIRHYLHTKAIKKVVQDPLFRPVEASYAYSFRTKIAYIEMAAASGLSLLKPKERNCMFTSSYGTGELIVDAVAKGAQEIILGIGGSATNDGGMGMAAALGFIFLDDNGVQLNPIGENLIRVKRIQKPISKGALTGINFKIACDVKNPLFGANGATQVYAPQKGANDSEVEFLEKGMRNYAEVIQEQYDINLQKIPGSGAAGGLGGGALVYLGGQLCTGIDLVKRIAGFDAVIRDADWIITGEGMLDAQTLSGKTISGVLASAAKFDIPVAAFCGKIQIDKIQQEAMGFSYAVAISEGIPDVETAMKSAFDNLKKAANLFGKKLNDTM